MLVIWGGGCGSEDEYIRWEGIPNRSHNATEARNKSMDCTGSCRHFKIGEDWMMKGRIPRDEAACLDFIL